MPEYLDTTELYSHSGPSSNVLNNLAKSILGRLDIKVDSPEQTPIIIPSATIDWSLNVLTALAYRHTEDNRPIVDIPEVYFRVGHFQLGDPIADNHTLNANITIPEGQHVDRLCWGAEITVYEQLCDEILPIETIQIKNDNSVYRSYCDFGDKPGEYLDQLKLENLINGLSFESNECLKRGCIPSNFFTMH